MRITGGNYRGQSGLWVLEVLRFHGLLRLLRGRLKRRCRGRLVVRSGHGTTTSSFEQVYVRYQRWLRVRRTATTTVARPAARPLRPRSRPIPWVTLSSTTKSARPSYSGT